MINLQIIPLNANNPDQANAPLTQFDFQELVLSYNEIQTEGGEALAKTCCELKSLQKVDLDGNHFGDEGKATVGAALGSRLSLLDPGYNFINMVLHIFSTKSAKIYGIFFLQWN